MDRLEDGLQEPGHGRLGDRAERQRADGDAELGRGHHLRQVLQAVQHLAGPRGLGGERFDLAAADRDEGELGADEEAVGEHEQQREQELEHAHRAASADRCVGGAHEADPLGAVALHLADLDPPAGQLDPVAGDRDPAEQVGDESGDGLVRALGRVEAYPAQDEDAAAAVGLPGGPAVLAGHHGEFGPAASAPSCSSRTSPTSSSTMSSRVTTPAVPPYSSTTTAIGCSLRSRARSCCTGSVSGTSSGGTAIRPTGVRSRSWRAHRERVLEVDHADDLVDPLPVDREAGQAGGAGEVEDVGGGRGGLQGADLDARGHDVLGGEVAEREGPYEEVGGVLFQGAGLRRVPDQGDQFAGGAGGGQLVGGLHAERPHQAVGDGVEQRDDRPEQPREAVLRAGDEAGHLERLGDRPVLRDEFADHHLHGGGEQHAERRR